MVRTGPVAAGDRLTWEEAVVALRADPSRLALVQACYYDDPIEVAAERYRLSEEWQATLGLVGGGEGRCALEIGAGRGISSYALASTGWRTVAVEPDSSAIVGAGAVLSLCRSSGCRVMVTRADGERLPFAEGTFDLVFGRATLHHARDLEAMCREVHRVLRPGGRMVFLREHVIRDNKELADFLSGHALHRLYGGERAYRLGTYVGAIRAAGMNQVACIGPYSSPVNWAPRSRDDILAQVRCDVARIVGKSAAGAAPIPALALRAWAVLRNSRDPVPGRHYSFVATKPGPRRRLLPGLARRLRQAWLR